MGGGQQGEGAGTMHAPATHPLDVVFRPRSIAVYGASREVGSMGYRAVEYLLKGGFSGTIVPINAKYAGTQSEGLRWYGSAVEYGGPIDQALVIVRAQAVSDVAADCVAAGVRSMAVMSGGFAETGEEGRARQEILDRMTRAAGLTLLGPNCLGFVNASARVYATASSIFQTVWPRGGPLAIISQSGAIAADLLERANAESIPAGFWVSTGNEAQIGIADCIDFVCDMPEIRAIALYLENVKEVPAFRAALERARRLGKRVVGIRPGRTDAGVRAIRSHTASIVTSAVLYDALFSQLGMIRVDSQSELVEVVKASLYVGSAPGRVAIVSSSGGSAAMSADAVVESGLALAEISAAGQRSLLDLVPNCSPQNPVDVTGAANQTPEVLLPFLSAVVAEPGVDMMVMIHGSGMAWRDRAEKISASLIAVADRFRKPVLFVGSVDADLRASLNEHGIGVFDDAVSLIRAMARLTGGARGRQGPALPRRAEVSAAATQSLDEDQALDFVERIGGVPVVPHIVVGDRDELRRRLPELRLPAVAKAVIPGVVHKTELHAVRLDLRSPEELLGAYDALAQICRSRGHPPRVLVQPMLDGVVSECLLSAFIDPILGPYVAVGAGGVHAEVLADVAVHPAPVSQEEALALLPRLRTWPHLARHRSGLEACTDELVAAIVALSRCIADAAAATTSAAPAAFVVREIEINPFMMRTRGSCAVDAVVLGLKGTVPPS